MGAQQLGAEQTRIAVDLGASSGRVIVGTIADGVITLDEVARFSNTPTVVQDGTGVSRLSWDWQHLTEAVIAGLHAAVAAHPEATTVGIDTWAVDYGLLDRDGQLIQAPVCYRDERCGRGVEAVHRRIEFAELYQRNGLQFLPFTTSYQLAAEPLLDQAETLLLIPDLLTHQLTGSRLTELSNASTTGLLDPLTREWLTHLIDVVELPPGLFTDLVAPGQPRGRIRVPGLDHLEVVTTASHDTAAAVAATPMTSPGACYISLGTWALVGLEVTQPIRTPAAQSANFTNEGGVAGTTRFLRNVMGTWLLTETLREWGEADLPALLEEAASLPAPEQLIEVDDPCFLPPGQLATRIGDWLGRHHQPQPASRAALVRLVVDSIAAAIAATIELAADVAGRSIDTVHVVGGGAQNQLLCQRISDLTGRPVVAGPVEATALGNLLCQSGVAGPGELAQLRALVANSTVTADYRPTPLG